MDAWRCVPGFAKKFLKPTNVVKQRTTVVEISGEVRPSVLIVGGRLAGFVGADVQRTLGAEEEFNDGHLVG